MVSEFIKSVKLKQNTNANCYIKHDLTSLEEPKNVRIKFSKVGSLQYISHLDLQRLLNRALVRAGIPMWYTKGFNPHAKMVFALPLPVGVESNCEFLDVKIDKKIDEDDIKELLNQELTDELQVLDVYVPKTKFSEISSAEYLITLCGVNASSETAQKIDSFFKGDPIIMTKRTKAGDKDIDIRDYIRDIRADYCEKCGNIKINVVLSAGGESLNPEFIMSALKKYAVLPEVPLTEESYSILRSRVLDSNNNEFR